MSVAGVGEENAANYLGKLNNKNISHMVQC